MNLSEINLSDFDLREAGDWPWAGKAVLVVLIIAAMLGAGYYFIINDQLNALDEATRKEQGLRQEFIEKWSVVANLEAFRQQLKLMEKDLEALLRQLPTGTEMPNLLDDVSNTGKKNGLEFELFKPESEQPKDFYAAKPITIKARGTYHQFGAFVSDVAALSRIVTLENATLVNPASKTGKAANVPLSIDATLQTYRYMDELGGGQQQRKGAGQK